MLSDCIYSINNRALNSRDNEYKYTHYIPNTYGNANKYHKKKLEYYQMKKVLLSILEPAHIQKGEVLQRKRTYDYEEGYEDILKSGNYVNNSGFYDPDRKEHVEFVVQMIPETVYYLTYTLSNRTFRVPLEESEIKQYPDLEVVDVGRITPVYGDITADMLSVQFVEKILLLIKNRNYTLIFENNTEQETEVKDELAAEPVSVEWNGGHAGRIIKNERKTNMYKGPKTTMYIVRSLNMVNWLCSHGFKILKVEDSEKDEKLKVFFFEESPALHHTMMMYRKEVWLYGKRQSSN